jgi:SAM-dependent methyltransferase
MGLEGRRERFAKFLRGRFSELSIDNFTRLDGTVRFYTFVRALMLRTNASQVLDYGAGRGGFWTEEAKEGGSRMRSELQDLRYRGARVTACDIDPAVAAHPCSDLQVIIGADPTLPWKDSYFDLVVSDMTFEHIQSPDIVCRELIRVVRPGGFICARTPNRWGYVALAALLIPTSAHTRGLKTLQPSRRGEDVFPTFYKLNDIRSIKKMFSGCSVNYYMDVTEPRYHFNSLWLFLAFELWHRVLPSYLAPGLCVFIQKPFSVAD